MSSLNLPRRGNTWPVLRLLGHPLLHLVRLVRRGGQLDEPLHGLGQADLALLRDLRRPLRRTQVLSPFVRFALPIAGRNTTCFRLR